MKRWLILSSIVGFYLVYGLFISQTEVAVVSPQLRRESSPEYYDYKGSIQVDANGEAILSASTQLGYDFVSINPVNHFSKNLVSPRYSHRTLMLPSYKLGYSDSRLLFMADRELPSFVNLSEAQTYMTDLLSQSQPNLSERLLILTHPLRPGYQWSGDLPNAVNGIEILNMRSMFEQAWRSSKLFCIWSLLIYPFNPRLASIRLFNDPIGETRLWDELSRQRRVVAYAAQDDIAAPVKWLLKEMRILSVRASLDFMSTHVWLTSELVGEPLADAKKIMNALRLGQSYLAIDALGDPIGFTIELLDGKKKHLSGLQIPWNAEQKLSIRIPSQIKSPVEVALFKDGLHFMSSDSVQTDIPLPSPGIYRAVVYVKPSLPIPDKGRWMPWIFTNAFYLK